MPPTRHERHTASAKVMFQYGNKKVLMRWPQSYKDAIVNARSELKLGDEELEMFIDMAEVKADRASGEMKLSPTSWDLLSECNNTPLIMLKRAELACVAPPYYMDSVCTLFQAGSVEEQPPPIAARPRFPSHVALASIPPKVSVGPSARLHSNECTKETSHPPSSTLSAATSDVHEKQLRVRIRFDGMEHKDVLETSTLSWQVVASRFASAVGTSDDEWLFSCNGDLLSGEEILETFGRIDDNDIVVDALRLGRLAELKL